MARDPLAGLERVRGRLDRRRDQRELLATGLSTDELYPIDRDWQRHLHEAVGGPWPCACEVDASVVDADINETFARIGLRGGYAGWCDGGVGFTRAAWCLVLHLQPRVVVETGVARGVTSRFILEALEQNGVGHLWSVDLPSTDSRFHGQIGAAVPERCRHRWTYLRGTSRQRLPPLLAELGEIDLFVHDSLHTGRTMRFELESAWQALRTGGALLVDDVYANLAFQQFSEAVRPGSSLVAANPDSSYRFGIMLKTNDPTETLARADPAGPRN